MRKAIPLLFVLASAACSEPVTLLWKTELGSASRSNPLVTDQFIALGHDRGLMILEPDGTPRCRFDAHGEVVSAPTTDGKMIFFGGTNYIAYAIDPQCQTQWKFPTQDRIKSDPLVHDGKVFFSSYDGHVYALKAATGERVWSFPNAQSKDPAEKVEAPPVPTSEDDLELVEVEGEPAPEKKPKKAPKPFHVGDFSYSSPTLHAGIIYLGNLDSYFYALRAKDGEILWRYKTEAPVTSTPLLDGGRAYFGSNDGNVYAIDVEGPKLRWKWLTKEWVNSSASKDGDVLYIGSNDRHVYAIEMAGGQGKWTFETVGPVIAKPVVHRDMVFAAGASGDGTVYAIKRQDGTLVWKYKTGNKIEADPVVRGNTLYVASTDGFLYAFRISAAGGS